MKQINDLTFHFNHEIPAPLNHTNLPDSANNSIIL